ncbi:MAG: J domain-containing protein [Candidatus Omnitrophota bacterium]
MEQDPGDKARKPVEAWEAAMEKCAASVPAWGQAASAYAPIVDYQFRIRQAYHATALNALNAASEWSGDNTVADYKQIDEARKLLGLGESATFQDIKEAFRRMSLKYHPDKCKDEKKKECEEMFKKINHANEVLMNYCLNFSFPFNEKSVKETRIEKELYDHYKRFYDGWWGNLDL